jgi:hypothetical protein
MKLQEFVKNVLVEIDSAVQEARKETSRDIAFSHTKDNRTVEFDVAVSVEESDAKSGGGGIKVIHFAEASGQATKSVKNSTVSRIQFGVKIDELTKDEQAARDAEWAREQALSVRDPNQYV